MSDFLKSIFFKNSTKLEDIKLGKYDSLIKVLFECCYSLPEEAKEVRPSFIAFNNVVKWGGSIENSLASAILTLGEKHGPFISCYDLIQKYFEKSLDYFKNDVTIQLDSNINIPGFGNPVIKSRDKRAIIIASRITEFSLTYSLISEVVERMIKQRKSADVFSNLAFWSACSAHCLGLPRSHASIIPIVSFSLRYLNGE